MAHIINRMTSYTLEIPYAGKTLLERVLDLEEDHISSDLESDYQGNFSFISNPSIENNPQNFPSYIPLESSKKLTYEVLRKLSSEYLKRNPAIVTLLLNSVTLQREIIHLPGQNIHTRLYRIPSLATTSVEILNEKGYELSPEQLQIINPN